VRSPLRYITRHVALWLSPSADKLWNVSARKRGNITKLLLNCLGWRRQQRMGGVWRRYRLLASPAYHLHSRKRRERKRERFQHGCELRRRSSAYVAFCDNNALSALHAARCCLTSASGDRRTRASCVLHRLRGGGATRAPVAACLPTTACVSPCAPSSLHAVCLLFFCRYTACHYLPFWRCWAAGGTVALVTFSRHHFRTTAASRWRAVAANGVRAVTHRGGTDASVLNGGAAASLFSRAGLLSRIHLLPLKRLRRLRTACFRTCCWEEGERGCYLQHAGYFPASGLHLYVLPPLSAREPSLPTISLCFCLLRQVLP
jgi:hypothetical protein